MMTPHSHPPGRRRALPDETRHKRMPEPARRLQLERRFTAAEYATLQMGLLPRDMDDHWFIYFDEERRELVFHRSWTSICIFIVRFEEEPDGGCHVADAWSNPDPAQFKAQNAPYAARVLMPLFDMVLRG